MNVINELEHRATTRDKEKFLGQLHNEVLSDLFLIYGRVGYATREERIAIIARCEKSKAEKLQLAKKFLASAEIWKGFFLSLDDTKQAAIWSRTLKRLKKWRRYFESEGKN